MLRCLLDVGSGSNTGVCGMQVDSGRLVMAGALTDPVDSALFIFKGHSKEVRMTAKLMLTGYIKNRIEYLKQTAVLNSNP